MNNTPSSLKAFKRATSLELPKWYMGILITNLAESKDTDGAFYLLEATLVPGTEPPPHVHSREDELFYVLEGEFDVYVGKDVFMVATGECIFLPRFKPHAFVIRSPRLRVLTLFTPGGAEETFRSMSSPAQNLEPPAGALTYSKADLKQIVQRSSERGVRILAPDEVADQLPLYPNWVPPTEGVQAPKCGYETERQNGRLGQGLRRSGKDYGSCPRQGQPVRRRMTLPSTLRQHGAIAR